MLHRWVSRVSLVLACALLAAQPGAAQERKPDTVHLALVISLANTPLYVARARGYFEQEGIALNSANFRGANDVVSALATGELDASLGVFSAGFLNAAARGLDLRIVASLGLMPTDSFPSPLMARKDLWDSGAFHTGADLKNHRVAINTIGGSVEYMLTRILDKYGMSLKDADVVTLSFSDMLVALTGKSIDAAMPTEPFVTEALHKNLAVIVPSDESPAGGEMTTAVLFSGKFIRERPDVAMRTLRAMIRGSRDVQGTKGKSPEIVTILASATGIAADTIHDGASQAFDPDLAIDKYIPNIRSEEAVHMKNGRLSYDKPIPIDQIVDGTLVAKAAASLTRKPE